MGSRVWVCTACWGLGLRFTGWNVDAVRRAACVTVVFLVFAGQGRDPFKIREQIKLEVLDSAEEEAPGKQSLAMASNSIFESFSSYQPCFNRGECHDEGLSTLFTQRDDSEVLVYSVTEVLKSCG